MTGIQNWNISKHALTRHPAQLHHRHENDVEGQQHGDDRIWLASRNSRLWQHRTDVSSTTSVSELDQTNPTLHTASAKPHSPPASKSQIHWFYPSLRGIWRKAQKKTILLWTWIGKQLCSVHSTSVTPSISSKPRFVTSIWSYWFRGKVFCR